MEDLFVPIISGGIYLGIITDMNTDGGDLVSKVLEIKNERDDDCKNLGNMNHAIRTVSMVHQS